MAFLIRDPTVTVVVWRVQVAVLGPVFVALAAKAGLPAKNRHERLLIFIVGVDGIPARAPPVIACVVGRSFAITRW